MCEVAPESVTHLDLRSGDKLPKLRRMLIREGSLFLASSSFFTMPVAKLSAETTSAPRGSSWVLAVDLRQRRPLLEADSLMSASLFNSFAIRFCLVCCAGSASSYASITFPNSDGSEPMTVARNTSSSIFIPIVSRSALMPSIFPRLVSIESAGSFVIM